MSKLWPDKFIIGLTGNIATGKSTIMRFAAEQGALTLDADQIVHQILDSDGAIQVEIAAQFGDDVRRSDGRINRAALGSLVFQDPEALYRLEQLIHPAVRLRIEEEIAASQAVVVMIEAIKLLEGPLATICDQIWVAHCEPLLQIERLMICRGLDMETAVMRVKAQPPQAAKVARADVLLTTDAPIGETRRQFEAAWTRLPLPPPQIRPAAEPTAAAKALQDEKRAIPQPATETKLADLQQQLRPPAPVAVDDAATAAAEAEETPAAIMIRRARPSDIPSILLLIQRATAGQVTMKRADLLYALGERGYLLGQVGGEIQAVIGWNTEDMVARIDQVYFYPLTAVTTVGPALLTDILESAEGLICEAIMAFLPRETPELIRQLFSADGYQLADKEQLPRAWQTAAEESQPDSSYIMLKVLRDARITQPM
jgi:dephospho-CoA kinase